MLQNERVMICGMHMNEIQQRIHDNAKDKGFWDTERNIPEMLCLIHSEVSEALEVLRGAHDGTIGEELADTVIRCFDLAAGLGIDLEVEIVNKHNYNITRPRMHGKKL